MKRPTIKYGTYLSRPRVLVAIAIFCSSLSAVEAETSGSNNVPKKKDIYELKEIGVSHKGDTYLPFTLNTSITLKRTEDGEPTPAPQESDIHWSATMGSPIFNLPQGARTYLDFEKPFVKENTADAKRVDATATYSGPATVESNPQQGYVDLVYLDFWIAGTLETTDDVLIVRPTDASPTEADKKVIHWAKVVVKHSAPGALPLKLASSGDRVLYFYGEKADPNKLTKEPTLVSKLEKGFKTEEWFWIGTDAKGTGQGKFKATGDLGTGYKDAPEEKTVNLLPVDIKEVISDQISGNEANKLPTAFFKGEPNNPILMATTSGVNARLKVKMNIDPSAASVILVGARRVGSISILGSVASVPPPGQTTLSFDAYDGHHIYEIVAGYDANSSGVLETDEVAVVFEKTPKTDSNGDPVSKGLGNLDKIIIVTQSAFDSGKSSTINYNVWGTDYAGDLISAFAHGSSVVDEATTTTPHNIISKQPGLSHPVGAKWNSSLSAVTHEVSFFNGSEAATDVKASNALSQVLESAIGKHLTAIRKASGSEWTYSGPYSFSSSRDFIKTDSEWVGINELGYAFGKVTFNGTMHVSSRSVSGGKIEVGSVVYSGHFEDVYDVTYWGGDKAREASLVQAGHATLAGAKDPNSGKVFFTRVIFSGNKTINKEF